jgi:ankyrin repeat protein
MSVDDLHDAAERGDVAEIRRLVAAGVDVNGVDAANKTTALHFAAADGHVEAVKILLQLSADIEAKTAEGMTPLHVAVVCGQAEVLETLVQLSANIEAMAENGSTPLHVAAFSGRAEAVQTLLQLGAQMGARTDRGETPLDLSVQRGHHQVAQVLRHFERTARPPQGTTAGLSASACAACGNTSGTSGAALKKCARCRSVKYCSVACQHTHWPVHKGHCAAAAGPSAS